MEFGGKHCIRTSQKNSSSRVSGCNKHSQITLTCSLKAKNKILRCSLLFEGVVTVVFLGFLKALGIIFIVKALNLILYMALAIKQAMRAQRGVRSGVVFLFSLIAMNGTVFQSSVFVSVCVGKHCIKSEISNVQWLFCFCLVLPCAHFHTKKGFCFRD